VWDERFSRAWNTMTEYTDLEYDELEQIDTRRTSMEDRYDTTSRRKSMGA